MVSTPQLPLADDLFLTAHDTVKGKSLLTPATMGLGLAGALLGELVLWRRLDVADGKIVLIDDRPTGDPAATAVLDQLLREGHHRAVRDWISFLATGIAIDLVERRLSRAGLVQRQEKRGLLSSKVYFVPTDSMVAGWPATRVRTLIGRGEMLDIPDLVLAGLILATGLDQHVFVTLDARGRGLLFDQLKRRLPAMLQELVGHTEAAVGDAVMARRA
ncbi:GPP34 family phosphoprotein [Actinoplanes sp. TBRC 11911]|uniref:GOLPH3/VPS74 family protein n=1 Tax=Actinoplanes sp. TBRC 11911 TaxID=2729386 RepID=UPI00145E944C|nr:GPP34 family phosphoprotein [Actinoplanes sp. TBRC 11911]NMO51494.1 GPP34 family phosphoprotein [Actinoplanes sp. TBRC 11911]